MRTVMWVIILLVVTVVIYFFVLGIKSKSGSAPGLINGALSQCGSKPNCVCSEQQEPGEFYIEPLALRKEQTEPLLLIKAVLQELKAEVTAETDTYLAATFTSGIFGFVDDLEVRWDQQNATLHLRSASRVGHSDLGANRKRVEQIRTLLQQQ